MAGTGILLRRSKANAAKYRSIMIVVGPITMEPNGRITNAGAMEPISAANNKPTTAAFTPDNIPRAHARCLSVSQNGSAAVMSSKPGIKIATVATHAPKVGDTGSVLVAPRNVAKVKSGPGMACATP